MKSKQFKYFVTILILFMCFCLFFPTQRVFAANPTHDVVYNIFNKASGKCLNVNYGTDANGTNVTQYTPDGSLEQRFKLKANLRNSFNIYPMCSSSGRVLDILRVNGSSSGAIASGCNIDIWKSGDNDAQDFVFQSESGGYFSIHPKAALNLAITTNGTSNGSGAGTSPTATGNVYVSSYTGADNQLWYLQEATGRCYYYTSNIYNQFAHSNLSSLIPDIGYSYIGLSDRTNSNFVSDVRNSQIFIYVGHGEDAGAVLAGNGNSNEYVYASNISSLPNNYFGNTKFIALYACASGKTNSKGENLVVQMNNKGAQCVVGWTVPINNWEMQIWNKLMFEKIRDENQSIVEGYRHADYWINSKTNNDALSRMAARTERGNNELHLYK